ncbi:hypothetical protein EAH68_11725 [Corynebacterium hylobatis]|uniref:AMIN-like domain-containing protein n=1 Tax=Corynebacterium hylobatis TaxID=1859290 RepID=A0A3S0BGG6_9CORY|nr:hypothetical protein [Corynebacterium hylobatis]RSZ61741.1 hypothetical protein EAH68_11725 [Corynebacterium hylobatis]
MTAYRRPLLPAALTAAALLLVACGNGGGSSTPTTTTAVDPGSGTSTVTATANPTATADERPLGQPDLLPKAQETQWSEDFIILDNIRAGSHDGFDRVVFDLTDGADPGWQIDYVDEPRQQASGNPVDVAGNAFLHVMITNTTYPFELGIEDPLEPGTFPGAGRVNEIAYTSIFEGYTEAYIGLDEQLPYSVTLLHNPTRVVIDFEHQ